MDNLEKLMTKDEAQSIGIAKMPIEQRGALQAWGLRMYTLGSSGHHHMASIAEVKYGGHLVILDDGSRWEVDEGDADTTEGWLTGDRVIVISGEMHKLDDLETVVVTADSKGGKPTSDTHGDLLEDLVTLDALDGRIDGKIEGL